MNFFGRELPVFKAALHTHSTCSDGRFRPEEVIAFYENAGFDVLAFTDHGKVTPVAAFRSRMTVASSTSAMPPATMRGPETLMIVPCISSSPFR